MLSIRVYRPSICIYKYKYTIHELYICPYIIYYNSYIIHKQCEMRLPLLCKNYTTHTILYIYNAHLMTYSIIYIYIIYVYKLATYLKILAGNAWSTTTIYRYYTGVAPYTIRQRLHNLHTFIS